jgi:hypothetical protein
MIAARCDSASRRRGFGWITGERVIFSRLSLAGGRAVRFGLRCGIGTASSTLAVSSAS